MINCHKNVLFISWFCPQNKACFFSFKEWWEETGLALFLCMTNIDLQCFNFKWYFLLCLAFSNRTVTFMSVLNNIILASIHRPSPFVFVEDLLDFGTKTFFYIDSSFSIIAFLRFLSCFFLMHLHWILPLDSSIRASLLFSFFRPLELLQFIFKS